MKTLKQRNAWIEVQRSNDDFPWNWKLAFVRDSAACHFLWGPPQALPYLSSCRWLPHFICPRKTKSLWVSFSRYTHLICNCFFFFYTFPTRCSLGTHPDIVIYMILGPKHIHEPSVPTVKSIKPPCKENVPWGQLGCPRPGEEHSEPRTSTISLTDDQAVAQGLRKENQRRQMGEEVAGAVFGLSGKW